MSFPTTLHLTWPRFFTRLASRLSVVNVHLLSLPSLACLHAEPSAFSVFNGYTLGCAAAVALVGAIFALGAALHVGLRGGSLADKRFGSFTNRCVTVALVVLYLAYPSVSQVVISMFNCQQVGDAAGRDAVDVAGAFPHGHIDTHDLGAGALDRQRLAAEAGVGRLRRLGEAGQQGQRKTGGDEEGAHRAARRGGGGRGRVPRGAPGSGGAGEL
jgi:hypothetical protein